MALTAGTLPSILPERVLPFDAATAFANGQTITSSGYVNAIQTQIDIGPGRVDGYLVCDISVLKMSATDETYLLALLGSNDAAFGNGNVDTLAMHDFAAVTAGRVIPTISAATPAVPITNRSSTRYVLPFSNFMGAFVFRYLQLRAVLGGTSPSITIAAWLTYDAD